jgi:membrane fusion protein, multidrug efflux system
MAYKAEDRGDGELLLLDRPRPLPLGRQGVPQDDKTAADGGTDSIRARGPAPQQRLPGEPAVVDSPPLHDDQLPDQKHERGNKSGGGFLRRHLLASAIGLPLFISVAAAGYLYWDYAQHFESTDDAYIAARQFAIAPNVSGYVTAVPVTDNQHVAAGDVLAQIDQRPYRIALDQQNAQLAHDKAVLEQAQMDLARYQSLVKTNAIARQQVDDQIYLVEQDKATVALDQANVGNAELNLSYTTVTAAQAGRVVSLSAAVGQYAASGTTLTMFVPDEIWITANFKETQLDAMRPEEPVTLAIDAYPERAIRGHVASVQPGSGPAFSLLPPQNATGNWVKIVQRVPVKVIIDNPPRDVALGPGMSVMAGVRVNPNPSLYEQLRARL